ncbi:hypothetical protein F5J12DRAFT_229493 [Pisolithus orientalis]|uniref:uncharacterized protein n=1 Tax=Pisolithus orientalis TaxID=936130 RepID=UPI0022250A56|nr:uncharacterized protein F5J12DRAFT_229493 [Pisolithus orientalis]KAI6002324.1 hypothetical protein F5J12DRAFT_229493 [Pisolithus orientalis]
MNSPIWKMVFVALVGSILDYSLSPPQPPPAPKELLKPPESFTTRFPRTSASSGQVMIAAWTLAEIAVSFAATDICPPNLSKRIISLLVYSQQPADAVARASTLTPIFFVGGCMIIAGSLLRLACFKILGRLFTYELSIRNEHKLITSGPYGFVRHPSYTGAMVFVSGQYLCMLDESSWLVACSGLFPRNEYVRKSVAWGIRIVLCSTLAVYLRRRMNEEDAMLEKHFGNEWKDWVKRVPYKIVPWVY